MTIQEEDIDNKKMDNTSFGKESNIMLIENISPGNSLNRPKSIKEKAIYSNLHL